MDLRTGIAAALVVAVSSATAGCGEDSCACQYPDDDRPRHSDDGSRSRS